jgi:hypothetical protein
MNMTGFRFNFPVSSPGGLIAKPVYIFDQRGDQGTPRAVTTPAARRVYDGNPAFTRAPEILIVTLDHHAYDLVRFAVEYRRAAVAHV